MFSVCDNMIIKHVIYILYIIESRNEKNME